ncbi:MAG TPA: ANTAR domain-containing protein [Acidimicrobiales bacterium]|nr:ANTAR domain-containing protein [Acidimicrobiales bacterium]
MLVGHVASRTKALVTTERLLEIFGLLARHSHATPARGSLCSVAAEFTKFDGANIALLPESKQLTALCSSNAASQSLLELEITLGEGPTTDACESDNVVCVTCLGGEDEMRWLSYSPLAIANGATSVYAFPITIGAARLGALTLFRWESGELSEEQESDAYLMASVVARAILDLQAGAPRGSIATQLEREAHFTFTVHQAAGMVAVQGSLSVSDALVALRAHSFATNQGLSELAARVVTRRIRYEARDGVWYEVYSNSEGSGD